MPLPVTHRKAELARLGLSLRAVARALKVSESLVGHVISGRRTTGDDARRVQAYIAKRVGLTIPEMFGIPDRRASDDRRDGADRRIPRERRKDEVAA